MDIDDQDGLKLNVKIWLKANSYDYAWLAEKCYVSESTVRNWMARKSIPKAKAHIIRQLIAQSPVVMPPPASAAATTTQSSITVKAETIVSFKLEQNMRKALEDKAFSQGLTLEEFLSKTLEKLTEE